MQQTENIIPEIIKLSRYHSGIPDIDRIVHT